MDQVRTMTNASLITIRKATGIEITIEAILLLFVSFSVSLHPKSTIRNLFFIFKINKLLRKERLILKKNKPAVLAVRTLVGV